MIRKLGLFGAALATVAGATIVAAPAQAQYYGNGYNSGYQGNGAYANRYNGNRYGNGYYNNGYAGTRYGNAYYGNRYYGQNQNYRYRCGGSGTTGTVLGAIVGGLLGDAAVGRRGDGTAGAIVGAGVGALAGRAIDRNGSRC